MINRMTRNIGRSLPGLGVLALIGGAGLALAAEQENRYLPYPQAGNIREGISWPKGQALPIFATPAATLDSLMIQDLSKDEQITFSALQGQVNRKQPRIYLGNERAEEGVDTWPETPTVGLGTLIRHDRDAKYDLLAKYAKETGGVVLYDPSISPHYRNLAGTVAALHRALPVTPEVRDRMVAHGIELEVVADLTTLKFTTALEIYQYLHETWWENCEKRVIVSAKPHDERGGGDYHHTRDIAAACGAAVIWLNTLIPAERELLGKFFGDMKAGEAVVLGWYTTERSGITTASEFGISTLPADHFMSASVFAGSDHRILIPKVPKKPALETKVYVAVFISDGDNIQYTQHAMRRIWDRTRDVRGRIPLNWTIAPGLVDIAPGILNHYYTTATANDCFVTGPSGMGYLMPTNTLTEPGAPIGTYLKDTAKMDAFARLTETYLQRSGLRVMTIWDDATPMQRASYEKHGRSLYGATVQNFKDVPSVAASVESGRVRFDKLVIPYAGSYEHLHGSLSRQLRRWDGKSPLFLSYQVDIWHELKPARLVELHDDLKREFPDRFEFVRADHYFNLHNESGGLPFNLCMSPSTSVRSARSASDPEALTDGTPTTLWTAGEKGDGLLELEFDALYQINRCVIRHAGDHGMPAENNTRSFSLQASGDGKSWNTVHDFKRNTANVTDVEFSPMRAKFFKIVVTDAGVDSTMRIANVEIYGSK